MVSPIDTFMTAGSNTMVPDGPTLSILIVCSEPVDNSILGKFTATVTFSFSSDSIVETS